MMEAGIYVKDDHDGEEIRRGIQISMLGLNSAATASFRSAGVESFAADWAEWLDGRWTPFFARHLVQIYVKSRAFEVDKIIELDAELSAFLEPDEAERSLAAGAELQLAAGTARHNRVMRKFSESAASESRIGQAATIFAMQAAEFNLPMFSMLISYLFFEWKAGASQLIDKDFEADERRFILDAMGALGGIRQLVQKHLGDFEPAACA